MGSSQRIRTELPPNGLPNRTRKQIHPLAVLRTNSMPGVPRLRHWLACRNYSSHAVLSPCNIQAPPPAHLPRCHGHPTVFARCTINGRGVVSCISSGSSTSEQCQDSSLRPRVVEASLPSGGERACRRSTSLFPHPNPGAQLVTRTDFPSSTVTSRVTVCMSPRSAITRYRPGGFFRSHILNQKELR